ncbi:hypothetical protein [Anaerocolumna chitinilytica]|uniref:Uncharacterized protein n=1 Tax=Anaerocolumna chitinilytica TaxID=1727145 RepID=A0A7I8DS29_9FIRM|nr:hypothetical protein [Anaerocolumna chitinilytica]BCK00042.1 hypothetical protein bsdcttw_30820 [Anaerocolumna chitinilytica]
MDFLVKNNNASILASGCSTNISCPPLSCGVNCGSLTTGCMIKL